jgi:hypothetical protein
MRGALCALALAAGLALSAAPNAIAAEEEWDKYALESASTSLSDTQAGAHADFTTNLSLTRKQGLAYANTRDIIVQLPPGLFGNPAAFPKCTPEQFGNEPQESACPLDSQVGSTDILVGGIVPLSMTEPIYNMPVPGGDTVARFGFYAYVYPVFINVRVDPVSHALIASAEGTSAAARLLSASTTFWGVPGSPAHDPLRWTPEEVQLGKGPPGGRPSNMGDTPFMTNPTGCEAGRTVRILARSYQLPESPSVKTVPFPQITGCGSLDFNPTVALKPSTTQGTTGTGLDYEASLPTKGLQFGNLTYSSEAKRAEVTLPEGMTVNPSEAEGLGVCSEEELARERYDSLPNEGCPETSKIGSVEAKTPVIDRVPTGSLYLAKPYQNPFGSLLALYLVVKVPDRGILVKLAGEVKLDPATGQITTTFDDVPQLPVADFKLHFREGARAPLITPPACGTYTALSNFTPWSAPGKAFLRESSFPIESGPDHGPCPTGGLPPFHPDLLAYTTNPIAGAFSPFFVSLTRKDSEQEITHFSIKLPPGEVAKLAGVPFCPELAIEAGKARAGIHGGEEELNAPSCPAASQIGTSLAGAGVGDVLVYVPGKVYLAGPYHGSPLSIVAITAAKAGPFDLGTVVIREALQVNPETAEVFIDATGSDPIPHIIAGIPVRLRDIRAYVDKPDFTLNPTSCEPTSTASTVLGAGLDFVSEADDNPLVVSRPFQAADCAALPFRPKLSFRLIGGHRRGQNPSLHAHLAMNGIGEAAIRFAQVALPRSEFLDNVHIGTVCTRVQFREGTVPGEKCPAASIYGHVSARTPILDGPLTGPIYLRSSEHELPDLVAALHHQEINIALVGRVDSVKGGGIRNTFEFVPDAPVTSADFTFFGREKGLLQNSTDLCKGRHLVTVKLKAHSGRESNYRTPLRAQCTKKKLKNNRHADR